MLLDEEIWDNTALYCQPASFQSWKGTRLSLLMCEGSHIFLSLSKTMTPHGLPKMPSLFRQKLHPANISNHSTETVAFIKTAGHRLWFSCLFREGLIPALEHHYPRWGIPAEVSGISLPPALRAPSPSSFSPALTQLCLIFCTARGNISS